MSLTYNNESAVLKLVLLMLVTGFCGCSSEPPPPMGLLSGTISFAKEPTSPLELMVISPSTGHAANAQIQAGAFSFPQPLLTGEYTAFLTPQADRDAQYAVPVTIDNAVPDKFWNEVQSPLKVQVAEGHNVVTFEVK